MRSIGWPRIVSGMSGLPLLCRLGQRRRDGARGERDLEVVVAVALRALDRRLAGCGERIVGQWHAGKLLLGLERAPRLVRHAAERNACRTDALAVEVDQRRH